MIVAKQPELTPYVRSNLPILPGSERRYAEDEQKKIENTLRSLADYVVALERRIAALEAKVP